VTVSTISNNEEAIAVGDIRGKITIYK